MPVHTEYRDYFSHDINFSYSTYTQTSVHVWIRRTSLNNGLTVLRSNVLGTPSRTKQMRSELSEFRGHPNAAWMTPRGQSVAPCWAVKVKTEPKFENKLNTAQKSLYRIEDSCLSFRSLLVKKKTDVDQSTILWTCWRGLANVVAAGGDTRNLLDPLSRKHVLGYQD